MAKSTKAKRARNAVGSAADNPYLRRLMEDEDLRESVRDAFESARDAYAAPLVERQRHRRRDR